MDNEEIIELFFSKYNEQAFNEKILEDIDYEIPHDLVLNYVRSVIQVPFNEYVDYVIKYTDDEFDPIEIEDIPVFYNLVDCRERMIDLMLMEDNRGLKLMEIGSYMKAHSISMNPGYTVVGRKSAQVAEALGIVYEYYNHWYLNCVAYVFDELSRQELQAFYARAILRNSFVKMLLVLCLQGRVSIYDFLFDPYQEVNTSTLRSIEFWFSTLHRAICKPYHLHEIEELEELHEREEKKAMSAVRGDLWSRKTDFDISSYVDEVCVAEVDLNDSLAYEPKDSMGNPLTYSQAPDGVWVKGYAYSTYSREVPSMVDNNGYYRTGPLPDFNKEIAHLIRKLNSVKGKRTKEKMTAFVKSLSQAYKEKNWREYRNPQGAPQPLNPILQEDNEKRRLDEERRARIEQRKKLIAEREEKRKLKEEKKRKEKEEIRKKLLEKEKRIKGLQAREREAKKRTLDARKEREKQEKIREQEEQKAQKEHSRKVKSQQEKYEVVLERLRELDKDSSKQSEYDNHSLNSREIIEENFSQTTDYHASISSQNKSNQNKSNHEGFVKYLAKHSDVNTSTTTLTVLGDAQVIELLRSISKQIVYDLYDVSDTETLDNIRTSLGSSREFKLLSFKLGHSLKVALLQYQKFLRTLASNDIQKIDKPHSVKENEVAYKKPVISNSHKTEEVKAEQRAQVQLSATDLLKLSKLFKNVSTTYKFFWMLALIDATESPSFNGKLVMRSITARMVANAWIALAHGINFPKLDKLPSVIEEAKKHNINTSTKQEIFRGIYAIQDANFHRLMDQLEANVPYRFLSPWIPYSSDQQVVKDSNDKTKSSPYSIKKDGRASELHITEEWQDYFRTNASALRHMTYTALAKYLQSYNPAITEEGITAILHK